MNMKHTDPIKKKTQIWPLLLVIAMYTVLFVPLLIVLSQSPPETETSQNASPVMFLPLIVSGCCVLFYLVVSFGSLVNVILSGIRGETDQLGRQASVLKMVSIPWFVINFAFNLLVFMIGGVASRGLIIIFVPIAVFITWCVMMGTTIYSLGYLILLKKEDRIGILQAVVHGFFQLMFMTDVIGILVLRKQMKRVDPPV